MIAAGTSRVAVVVLALATLAATFSSVPVHAQEQEQEQERIGLLNRLFNLRKTERVEPKAEVIRPKSQRKRKAPVRAPVEGEQAPLVAVVTKHPDARVVLVIGDFLASGLAEGLTTAFTQNANLKVVDRSSGSSGFVRTDFHDWAKRIDSLITSEKPAVVVVMIGANDRQQMLVDGVRETVRSENWNKEYARRAAELAQAIAARKVPFLWVGMPPFKSQKTMLDMLAFNEIYRAVATSAGGEFVDIWDGFVDENGAYLASGPDLNGQPARLRANDGINLARPGKRKIAFFAEKPLYKMLGGEFVSADATANLSARPAYRIFGPLGPSELQIPGLLDIPVNPNEVGPVDIARPIALRTPGLDGGVELLGAIVEPLREARSPAEKLLLEGIAPAAPAGRADQFAGTQLASAAGATRQLNIDTTLNRAYVPSSPQEPATDRAAIRRVRSNALSERDPPAPRPSPEIIPDRLGEISPMRPAPDIAAAEPPMITPATIDKGPVPDFARGAPLDVSPAREAPQQAIKRPTSIGPGPNHAPTAVPEPPQDVVEPSATGEDIPSASLGVTEPGDDSFFPRDTAPARMLVRSTPPEATAGVSTPARSAPRVAEPGPIDLLPPVRNVPSKLQPAPEAPLMSAPRSPVEPAAEVATAKAIPATETIGVTANAPARSVSLLDNIAADEAPARLLQTGQPPAMIDKAPAATPLKDLVSPTLSPEGSPQPPSPGTPANAAQIRNLSPNDNVGSDSVKPVAPVTPPGQINRHGSLPGGTSPDEAPIPGKPEQSSVPTTSNTDHPA